jgi:hypothetical protein
LAGRHGKGSGLVAKNKHGAIRGVGEGIQGNSYGIPTKDHALRPLSLLEIKASVDVFIEYAKNHPEMVFYVCAIGCMNAGYTPEQIGPMFEDAPDNCTLPKSFVATFSWPSES